MDVRVLKRWLAYGEKNDGGLFTDRILTSILKQKNMIQASCVDGIQASSLSLKHKMKKQGNKLLKVLKGCIRNKTTAREYTCAFNIKHYPGMIDNIKMKKPLNATIKVGIEHILHKGGHLHTGVLDAQATDGVYKVEIFEGNDLVQDVIPTICFCFRISTETPNGPVFLSSNLDDLSDTNVYLKVGEYDDIQTHIDERCFIVGEFGNKRTLRSLIRREHFISYNKDNDNFVMKEIPMKQYRAYVNGLNSDNPADHETADYMSAEYKLSDCWFDFNLLFHKCGQKLDNSKNIRVTRVSMV